MSKINLKSGSDPIDDYLQMYHAVYDTETKEVTLTCICDGTGSFLAEMQILLRRIGCVDIKLYSDVNDKYGTEEKPWATCKFTAVGKLPVELCKKESAANSYEDSPMFKWISAQYSKCVADEVEKEALRISKDVQAVPVEARYFINGKEKVCAFSHQELKNNHPKNKRKKKKL